MPRLRALPNVRLPLSFRRTVGLPTGAIARIPASVQAVMLLLVSRPVNAVLPRTSMSIPVRAVLAPLTVQLVTVRPTLVPVVLGVSKIFAEPPPVILQLVTVRF